MVIKERQNANRIAKAFLNYRDVLTRSLLRMSVKPSDVDDILQESLTRAIEANNKKRLEYPKSYLFTISRNMVFREHQRSAREVQIEIDEAIIDSGAPPLDDELHFKKMLQVFWEAMDSLPEKHRRAILLRRIYGLSQKEIAKKMGVSLSSVEKYFALGINRCQVVMTRKGYSLAKLNRAEIRAIKGEAKKISDKCDETLFGENVQVEQGDGHE